MITVSARLRLFYHFGHLRRERFRNTSRHNQAAVRKTGHVHRALTGFKDLLTWPCWENFSLRNDCTLKLKTGVVPSIAWQTKVKLVTDSKILDNSGESHNSNSNSVMIEEHIMRTFDRANIALEITLR